MSEDYLQSLMEYPEAIRAVVVIVPVFRSGSYLLSNLFDNHPEVLSVPPHAMHFFFHDIKQWSDLVADKDVSIGDFKLFVEKRFEFLFREADHVKRYSSAPPGTTMVAGVPRERFMAHFGDILERLVDRDAANVGNLFRAIHIAYAAAIPRRIESPAPIIVWQKHLPISDDEGALIRDSIGEATFLVTVRTPHVGFNAHYQHFIENESTLFDHLPLRALRVNLHAMRRSRYPGPAYAVRFEDLHTRTEPLMRALARHLGIAWDPVLLKTTLDGETFYFPTAKGFITGTNPNVVQQRKTRYVSSLDIIRWRHGFAERYRDWGYALNRPAIETLLRFGLLRRLLFALPSRVEINTLFRDIRGVFTLWLHTRRELATLMANQGHLPAIPLLDLDAPPADGGMGTDQ
ncbi:MAG: sulfotransferase [Alphaproteobacteria bacterium]